LTGFLFALRIGKIHKKEIYIMGYYVRAFCTSTEVPKLKDVLEWLKNRGVSILIDDEEQAKLDSLDWKQISLYYKKGKLPIVAECNLDDGTEDCLVREEVNEFSELIGKPGFSINKRRVLKHLANTNFTIACQLMTSDIDDDGYEANGEFLKYFIEHCDGMIQADGEGFYSGNDIIVKLE
jgi:hypothetical protein